MSLGYGRKLDDPQYTIGEIPLGHCFVFAESHYVFRNTVLGRDENYTQWGSNSSSLGGSVPHHTRVYWVKPERLALLDEWENRPPPQGTST